jgi:integrase
MVEAYTRADNQEGALRALVLLLCFMAAGRCGEVAFIMWSLIEWDSALGIAIATWRDAKTSKDKPVPFIPAADAWASDIYLAFADAAAYGVFNLGGPSTPKLLFPELDGLSSVANKVSQYLQDATPGSKSKFASFLPKDSTEFFGDGSRNFTSHGIRHGACDEMGANGVNENNASDLTAHAQAEGGGKSKGGGTFVSTYRKVTKQSVVLGKRFFRYINRCFPR